MGPERGGVGDGRIVGRVLRMVLRRHCGRLSSPGDTCVECCDYAGVMYLSKAS